MKSDYKKGNRGLIDTQSKCWLNLLITKWKSRYDGIGWMQWVFICWLILALMHLQLQSTAQSEIIDEDFTSTDEFDDLSTKLLWGNNTDITSGFILGEVEDSQGTKFQSLSLTEKALKYPGYRPGTLQASLAIDYPFYRAHHRKDSVITIEFDAFWEEFNEPWGESGRIVFTLLHDYPSTEIPFDAIYDLGAVEPFGRPAYNLRIRNTGKTGAYSSGAFMLYGGGKDVEGEVEKYTDASTSYWLPGFSSEAGGTTPGQLPPYPYSPTQKNEEFPVASLKKWRNYRWVIEPDQLQFFVHDESLDKDSLVFFMETPVNEIPDNEKIDQINMAHGSNIISMPVLYHYFEAFEAVRIYFRGAEQTHLANLKITIRPIKIPEPIVTAIHGTMAVEKQVLVYPNPNNGNFTIKLDAGLQIKKIMLKNYLGQMHLQHMPLAKGTCEVTVPQNQKGCFLLSIETEQTFLTKKIVIY